MFGNGALRTYHSLRVRSERLGLVGVCDRVDFELDTGNYIPVEFKHGKRRNELSYEAQLCAQAICIEEMFNCDIPIGYLYFIATKRRLEVLLSDNIRKITMETIGELREMICAMTIPHAEYSAKCRECSLREICIPQSPRDEQVAMYIEQVLTFAQGGGEP